MFSTTQLKNQMTGRRGEQIKLFLVKRDEIIFLKVEDEEGAQWTIMRFENGQFLRATGVPYSIGIEIDADEKIKEYFNIKPKIEND